MVDESDKKSTTVFSRAIAPDGGIVCELFEGRVHAEFGLLHAGDQNHAIAVEVQEPAPL